MDVARIGLAHGTPRRGARAVPPDPRGRRRAWAAPSGSWSTCPGPKVRLANFGDHPLHLGTGHRLSRWCPGRPTSDDTVLGVDYEALLTRHPAGRLPGGRRRQRRVAGRVGRRRLRPSDGVARRLGAGTSRACTSRRTAWASPHRPPRTCACSTPSSRPASTWWRCRSCARATTSAGSAPSRTREGRCWWPRSRPVPRSRTWRASSRPPGRSWSPAATWARSWASRSCPTCRSRSSGTASRAASR